MDDGSGWQRDPARDAREWDGDGSDWGDRVSPADQAPAPRPPDHVPALHRAFAAAVDDIDVVEDRLSTLFERPGGTPREDHWSRQRPLGGPGRDPDDDIFQLLDEDDLEAPEDPHPKAAGVPGRAEAEDGDEDLFAELDAALAAEEPDEPGDGHFHRRG